MNDKTSSNNDECQFPFLCLNEWPFSDIVDKSTEKIYADRKEVNNRINSILRDMTMKPSKIYILWGSLGSGKSHMLKHLLYRCKEKGSILFSYSEFPSETKRISFMQMYNQFTKNLNWPDFKTVFMELKRKYGYDANNLDNNLCPNMISFRKAADIMCFDMGDSEAPEIVKNWLCGEKVNLNQLRKLGISKRIEAIDDAINVFTCLTNLVSLSSTYNRLVWVIDEFNNIENLAIKDQIQILQSLRSLINNCPTNLTLIFSFGLNMQNNVLKILKRDEGLLDRIRGNTPINIPEWGKNDDEEILEFVRDRLKLFRSNGSDCGEYFPFEKSSILEIIKFIRNDKEKNPKIRLVPRTVLSRMNIITNDALESLEQGKEKIISVNNVQESLNRHKKNQF